MPSAWVSSFRLRIGDIGWTKRFAHPPSLYPYFSPPSYESSIPLLTYSAHDTTSTPRAMAPKTRNLFLVFVHGFKGDNDTFGEFPRHLAKILQGAVPSDIRVWPIIYPQYETAGELSTAMELFKTFLIPYLDERYKEPGSEKSGDKRKRAKPGENAAILVGHSMGGILIAETVLNLQPAQQAQILGVLAFDTPYLGLNPNILTNATDRGISQVKSIYNTISTVTSVGSSIVSTATSALGSLQKTTPTPASGPITAMPVMSDNSPGSWLSWALSSGYGTWALGAGAVAATTAAATIAYNKREMLPSWSWIEAHLRFVKVLFEPNGLIARLGMSLLPLAFWRSQTNLYQVCYSA